MLKKLLLVVLGIILTGIIKSLDNVAVLSGRLSDNVAVGIQRRAIKESYNPTPTAIEDLQSVTKGAKTIGDIAEIIDDKDKAKLRNNDIKEGDN